MMRRLVLAAAAAASPLAAAELEDEVSLLQVARAQVFEAPKPYFWLGKNGDMLRTGASAFAGPFNLSAGPSWSWHEEGNGVVRAAPLIDGDRNIYLATIKGGVYKFTEDGRIVWRYQASASIPEVPAILDGLLYATTDDGNVMALDMLTGQLLWRTKAGARSAGDTWSMTAGEGTVIAATSKDGKINTFMVAMDAKGGNIKWSFKLDVPVYNVLAAIKDGSVVFSDCTGSPFRLRLSDGAVIWHPGPAGGNGTEVQRGFSTGGAVIGPNGVVYVTSNAMVNGKPQGHVTAFRFEDGRLLWRQSTGYEANNAAAVGPLGTSGRLAVVVGVGSNPDMPDLMMQLLRKPPTNEKRGRVLALDAETGAQIWQHELPMWHGWAAGDTIVPNHVCLPDSFGNPALAADGTVYVGFESGLFYGIRDQDGNGRIEGDEVASFDTGNAFQGSPGIAPGLLVATPCNGLHVFRAAQA
mmetsp:Transcript_85276/g.276105  ORF Transcript_85276/g.276105 Transcript_85276/m.276105 type:complete len:467 (-) Transcript_85276:116-1516(-)